MILTITSPCRLSNTKKNLKEWKRVLVLQGTLLKSNKFSQQRIDLTKHSLKMLLGCILAAILWKPVLKILTKRSRQTGNVNLIA